MIHLPCPNHEPTLAVTEYHQYPLFAPASGVSLGKQLASLIDGPTRSDHLQGNNVSKMTDNNHIEWMRGASEWQFDAQGEPDRSISDDGAVHITRNGTRFCFDIGQGIGRREWTRQAREIGRNAGIPTEEVNEWIRTEFGR